MGRVSHPVAQAPAERWPPGYARRVDPVYTTRTSSLPFGRLRTRDPACAPSIPAYSTRGVIRPVLQSPNYNQSRVSLRSSERSSHQHQSTSDLESIPSPEPHVQIAPLHVEHADTRDHVVAPLVNTYQISASAAKETVLEPVSESQKGELNNSDVPRVKMLLCGDGRDPYAAADLKRLKATCLKCIDGLHLDNIRVYSEPGRIGEEFDWFFDPDDIAPGGLLILCFTGHGTRTIDDVDLKMDRTGEKAMDTLDLHTALNKIQVPCTIEFILGACNSEAVIFGLDRLLAMEITEVPEGAQSLPPLSALFKGLALVDPPPKLTTKAKIIVWAAAVDGGIAYAEADLLNRKGKNDIMIGALCKTLRSAKGPISRRVLFEKISKTVTKYNTARDRDYFSKTDTERYHAQATGKYRGPQLACLLSSLGNSKFVLDSPAFIALDGVDMMGTHN